MTVIGSFARFIPNRARLRRVKRLMGSRVRGLKYCTTRFGAVTVSSNVTVKRSKVLCSLPSHSVVTSDIRCVIGTRGTSTVVYVSGYSGVAPNVLVTDVQLGVPAIFISNNPVRTRGVRKRGTSLVATVVGTTSGDISSRRVRRVRSYTYPNYNDYSKVFATGSVGDLARTVKLSLPNGNAVLTARTGHVRLFGSTTGLIIRGTFGCCRRNSRDILPGDVTAHHTFLGTVALSVTVNNSSGAILRLLTITGRTNISFGVTSVSTLDHGIPYLYGVSPGARGCSVRRYGHTNNVLGVLKRLTGINLLSARYGHIGNDALNRSVQGCDVLTRRMSHRTRHVCDDTPNNIFDGGVNSRGGACRALSASHTAKYVHSIRRTCDGSNKLTILFKGVTRSNYIIGATNISRDV